MNILYAILVLGIMGGVFGLVLAIASKVFYVQKDERLEPITEALPGANCGGCGFSGCAAYAQAIIDGTGKIGLCAVGGKAVNDEIAAIMGVEPVAVEKKVAMVQCRGHHMARKGRYDGLLDCEAAAKLAGGGPTGCGYGCLGYGNCAKVCPTGAISVVDGVAQVDREVCVGCMACQKVCPRGIIQEIPYRQHIVVGCSSKDKGAAVRKVCDIGCIGCRLCERTCPHDAIHVTDNLAVIDYAKCVSCGACVEKCPRKLLSDCTLWGQPPVPEAQAQ